MKKLVLVTLLCFFATFTFAQQAQIRGVVNDKETKEPLIGANVVLKGTHYGAATDNKGNFFISKLPAATYLVQASFIGYESYETAVNLEAQDSVTLRIALEPKPFEREEVVVTGTRTAANIADVPVRVEAVPQEEIEEKTSIKPASVAMLVSEATGLRLQTTSATSNSANLRIQGLQGRYTQILLDGVPNLSGLSAGFGLTQLPPLNLRQVEIVKGAGSVLYGPDAISGVINFITKEPRETPELTALINRTSQEGTDFSAFYGQKFNRFGLTVLVSRNLQSRFDVDKDHFSDLPEYERWSVSPKLIYQFSEKARGELNFGLLSEDRLGGVIGAPQSAVGSGAPYLEQNQSERFHATGQMAWNFSPSQALAFKFAAMRLKREAFYGKTPFNAVQKQAYAEGQYTSSWRWHKIVVGAALNVDDFDDRTSGLTASRDFRYSNAGLFAQDELKLKLAEKWTLLGSGRVDFHNEF